MAIFSHHGSDSSSSSNHTCPMPSNLATDPEHDFITGYTFQHFNIIVSGACAAFSILSIFGLMLMHATHYSHPNEQGKIMRICFVISLYAGFSWLSVVFPNSYVYLTPWQEYFQGIALGSFFLLLCQFVSPDDRQRENYFAPLQIKQKRAGKLPMDGLTWYRRKWIFIFQYPVVAVIVVVATSITQAAQIYCLESSAPYHAHLWIEILSNVSLTLAVMACLSFYAQLRNDLKHHKPLAKLLAFKLLIGLTFIETILFWILRSTHILVPNATLTYADVNMGIPAMVVCIEMIPFSIFFWYAYSFKPYLLSNSRPLLAAETADTSYQGKVGREDFEYPANGLTYQGGFLGIRAWVEAFNPIDVLRAIAFAFSMASRRKHEPVQPPQWS